MTSTVGRHGMWRPFLLSEVSQLSDEKRFGEFATRWISEVAPLRLRATGVAEYRSVLTVHLLPELSERPLAAITADELQHYMYRKVACGLAPRSVRNHLVVLRSIFKTALALGYVDEDPAVKVMPPRHFRSEQRFLQPAEMRAVLEHCPSAWVLLLALPMYAAARRGEALALRWSSVSTERRQIAFVRSMRQGVEYPVKSAASRACVPMAEALVPLFSERRERVSDPVGGYVFCNRHGEPLGDHVPGNILRRACIKAGIEPCTYHQLRHSAIAALIATGAHPRVVQEFARHASFDTTMSEYGHLVGSAGGDAVADLSRLISGS